MLFQILRPLKKGLFVDTLGADTELHAKLLNIVISAAGVIAFTYLANKLQRQKLLYALCFFLPHPSQPSLLFSTNRSHGAFGASIC